MTVQDLQEYNAVTGWIRRQPERVLTTYCLAIRHFDKAITLALSYVPLLALAIGVVGMCLRAGWPWFLVVGMAWLFAQLATLQAAVAALRELEEYEQEQHVPYVPLARRLVRNRHIPDDEIIQGHPA